MKIEEAFKLFHDAIMKDPINKDPKNRQLTIDIHKQTQLVDIRDIFQADINVPYVHLTNGDTKAKLFFDNNIVLPFPSNFIYLSNLVYDVYNASLFLYIREYSPGVYTGTFLIYDRSTFVVILLFTIEITGSKVLQVTLPNYKIHELNLIEHSINGFIKYIMNAVQTLEKTSKTANIYKTDKVRYVTFKNKKTKTKETVKKPVYVYMSKTKSISEHKEYGKEPVTRENSWLVRGHWRKLFNEEWHGRDSEGKPTKGYTWVRPFKKGNLEKDVEQRTYIYKK